MTERVNDSTFVMAGHEPVEGGRERPVDPAIPARDAGCPPKRDRRVKPGDDSGEKLARQTSPDTPLFRFTANMLAFWGVCANASCRRARACRGDAKLCVARHAPLVPPDAREGMKAMIEGKQDGACFDTVQDHAYDEIEALMNWRAAIERANGTPLCAKR